MLISKRPPTNVILIVIDTLRADHLGCYGYERDTSPQIDRLSETGILFQNAYCQMPSTGPSHASIFTSRYPRNHGLLKNGWDLSHTCLTLAEKLQENDYTTAAIVSSFALDKQFGYAQGFDYYDDNYTEEGSSLPDKNWEGHKVAKGFDQLADVTTQKAVNWIGQHNKEKFFLFVHYFDPHVPYTPPDTYVRDFLKEGMNSIAKDIANYDGEVRFVDAEVGKLLTSVKAEGLDSHTLIIITSDHGEGLHQHGWKGHGVLLYDEATRIPLIMTLPGIIPEKLINDSLIESIDIAPTILDVLGLAKEKNFSGESLLPIMLEDKSPSDPTAFLERRHFKNPEFRGFSVRGNKFAVRQKHWKYIWAPEGGIAELYDLAKDPQELSNVVSEHPEVAAKLKEMIILWKEAQESGQVGVVQTIDQQSLDKLKALGYVE
jgi:arylsulfatase A-like enzyme